MPKILITGNGFDLNFGLPTSYDDFIKILNFISSNEIDFENIYSKTKNYEKLLENFSPHIFDDEKIEVLRTDISKNLWFNFFKNEYEIDTWIDFENKIEYVLKILFHSLDYIKEKVFSKGSIKVNQLSYDTSLFGKNIEIVQVMAKFGIITLRNNSQLGLNKEYLEEKYGLFINVDLGKITRMLYQELVGFKKIFNYFFEIFVFPFYSNLKKKTDTSIYKNIDKHYTFNYTPTFDKIYHNSNITNFLHGKVDSDLNKIVLGISEIPKNNVDNKYFIPFTKYFQKLNNDTDYIFINEYEKSYSENFMFFFMGHSLDKSDAEYINEVFDFVNNLKSNIKKIIVIYHNETSKSNLIINLLDIRGKDDIQYLMKNNILEFHMIDSSELKTELLKNISRTPVINPGVY
ncbi:hypothetical protein G5B37_03620 [Rasiella rasia]|uniref:Bacteriophage abortive infection AbiH n=1 Tax=Rasiella rasia TaxID=2744027 RepID=A0A6G6GLW1_9FLAO|nr:AbiH family protein [Rasiella rasia]QIE58681.1 hypothetical protein G5B37_03620 [Rasiella rasia]